MQTANASTGLEHTVKELPYGVALYNFYQGNSFSSITDILVAKELNTIADEEKTIELLLGSLYLSYGLQGKAHEIFGEITSGEIQLVPEKTMDQAWFHIGKHNYLDGRFEESLLALAEITNNKESSLGRLYEAERLNILGEILLREHQHDDVLAMLDDFPEDSEWKEYTQFNLAVDMVKNDRVEEGVELLKQLSESEREDRELSILHDQASLALAASYAKQNQPELSVKYFENIRLGNPQSNNALLGLGWVKFQAGAYNDALSAWLELAQGSKSDADVQEALMMIPYVLEKNGQKQQALKQYDVAIKAYTELLDDVERVQHLVNEGEVVRVLKESAINEVDLNSREVVKLMGPDLSDYLFEFITSDHFKNAINDYRELVILGNSLSKWERSIPSLKLILDEQIKSYNERLVVVVKSLKFEHAKKLYAKRMQLVAQLDKVLTTGSTKILVTNREKEQLEILDNVKRKLDSLNRGDPEIQELQTKYQFLAGLMKWDIGTDYAPRVWVIKKNIKELDNALRSVNRSIDSLTGVWKSAPAKYKDFENRIKGKKEHIENLYVQVEQAKAVQEKKIQVMAKSAIEQYRAFLKKNHDRALFSKARVYDSMVLKN